MFKEIKFSEIKEDLGKRLSKDFGLVTAGNENDLNTMTVSWGAFGQLWNMDMVTIYIRKSRYTIKFLERENYFTISFFENDYKKQLGLCGVKSGREIDKVKETGFNVCCDKAPFFEEASLVLICRKVAKFDFETAKIFDENIVSKNYGDEAYHYAYNGVIEKVLIKE